MKTYTLSFADSLSHAPAHPDRTGYRAMSGMNMDVVFQVWPSRAALLKTIEIQSRRAFKATDWKPCLRHDGQLWNARRDTR